MLVKNKRYFQFNIFVLFMVVGVMLTVFSVNFIVDPFNLNGKFKLNFNKELISYKANYRLYKMIEYKKNPYPNILLGDSRMDSLDTKLIKTITGEEYFNFAYGGGTLYEAIETFWYAVDHQKLKKVYIGVNFNLYNQNNRMSLIPEAKILINEPMKYYTSPFVTKVSFYNIIGKVTGENLNLETPVVSKEAFWKSQLEATTHNFYDYYVYPQDIYNKLQEIKIYCAENDINLVFVIPPTHVDLQNKVSEYKLHAEYIKYKQDLSSISTTIDFDNANEWTNDESIFNDPYHFDKNIMKKIITEIWTNSFSIGRKL